jgi:carboxypeptidase Q
MFWGDRSNAGIGWPGGAELTTGILWTGAANDLELARAMKAEMESGGRMRIPVAALLCAVLSTSLHGQEPERGIPRASSAGAASTMQAAPEKAAIPPELKAQLEKLNKGALESDYAYRQLRHLTNNIGPRLSGSPQAQFAAEYVAEEMRRLGLKVTLEKVRVPHWVRGIETGELVQYPGQTPAMTQKIVLTALGGSAGTPAEGITADVVVVRTFDELQARGRDAVAGKIVLFDVVFDKRMAAQNEPGPAYGEVVAYRGGGAKAAAALGAVGSLVRSAGGADYRLPHTGDSTPAGIPAAAVTAEDAELMADLAAQGRVRMHLTLTCQTLPDVESANVVADLEGREHPEQVVIVSGHLDSWDLGTGAIDDGAGVSMAMATAALFKQLGLRPRRTLRVIAWMNEENGLNGSKTYAKEHAAEFSNHVAAIESDFGAGHPLGFRGRFGAKALEMLRPVQDVLHASGSTLMRQTEARGTGSDIAALGAAGVPVFGFLQDGRTYFDYHHTAADTLDKVDPKNLAENVAAMAVLAYALAEMPEPLPR